MEDLTDEVAGILGATFEGSEDVFGNLFDEVGVAAGAEEAG